MAGHRVVVVTSHLPTATNAGNLAYSRFVFELLASVSEKVVVVVVSDRFVDNEFVVRDPSRDDLLYVSDFARTVAGRLVLRGAKLWAKNLLRRLWSASPSRLRARAARWHQSRTEPGAARPDAAPVVDGRARALLMRSIGSLDATHLVFDKLDHLHYLREIGPRRGLRIGIICHDLVSRRQRSAEAAGVSADMQRLSSEEEMERLSLADFIVSIQKDEGAEISGRVPGRVAYIPYVPEIGSAAPERGTPEGRRGDALLFVGSGGGPNVQGLTWFLTRVWPSIVRRRPEARLDVVGAVGNFVSHDVPGASFHGKVPELGEYYRRASVVVVPLRTGSGLKIKLVEALAAGSACVTTSVGAQGLEDGSASAFLVEDDPEQFADAACRLLSDAEASRHLRSAASAFFERHFDVEVAREGLRRAMGASRQP